MLVLQTRNDLMAIFNASNFTMRHYARGYYPVSRRDMTAMPVNRMFFPLENPNGRDNFIEDSFRRYTLIPGKLYFVPAFLPARFQLDNQLFFLSIQTSLEIFPGVELFSGCSHMLELPEPMGKAELLKLFDSDDEMLYLNAIKSGCLFFSMLIAMLDHYTPEDFRKPLALRQYAKLTDYLKEYGNAQTVVQDLADQEKESRENFTRHFSTCTGITPKQLIDRFVISRCMTLINQGYSFKETSHILRFPDEFAFSRYFKRNMGESPRTWKNRQFCKFPARFSADNNSTQ